MVFDPEVDERNPLPVKDAMVGRPCPVLNPLYARLIMSELQDYRGPGPDGREEGPEMWVVVWPRNE